MANIAQKKRFMPYIEDINRQYIYTLFYILLLLIKLVSKY